MAERQHNKQEEQLNESWVDLSVQNNGSIDQSTSLHSIHNGNFEKLLYEAQLESRSSSKVTSTASSRGSPKGTQGPPSPNHPVLSDWIWDWSSRPELLPPSDHGTRFKHPGQPSKPRRHKLSVRNTSVMRSGLFNIENLPTLLLTHACTFFLGAATMVFYLKRYCNWAAAATTTVSLD